MQKVLFLHGALGSKSQFNGLMDNLNDQIECHAINLAGHGGELIPPEGLTFQVFANNIKSYLDKNGIEKTGLFGFSMGGYAALYFAKLYPERVTSVMTLNVKFNWDPMSTAKEMGLLDPDKMLEKVPAFANNLMVMHGINLWKNLLSGTGEMMKKLSETIVMSDEELAEISCRVLLGVGDRDTTSSIAETERVYRLLKQAGLWVLPDTAHPFEKVDKQILSQMVLKFFKG